MTDIQAGDVVVAIHPDFACVYCMGEDDSPDGDPETEVGRYYTVRAVIACECPLLLFEGAGDPCCGGWSSCCFRKVEAPRTEVSERIKRCRPVKVPEPASVDGRRMAETPLGGSGRSPTSAVPAQQGDAHPSTTILYGFFESFWGNPHPTISPGSGACLTSGPDTRLSTGERE